MQKDNPKTYIASIRIDVRNLAKIAIFLDRKGQRLETKGKLASEGLRILAEQLDSFCSCETFTEAILTLTELGYENPKGLGTRYEKQIALALKKEISEENLQKKIDAEVSKQVKDWNGK